MSKSWKDETLEELEERFRGVSARMRRNIPQSFGKDHTAAEYMQAAKEGGEIIAARPEDPAMEQYMALHLPSV